MQATTYSQVEPFLQIVSRLGDSLGFNSSQLVYIEDLRRFPYGSLGRELANFFDENGLSPFLRKIKRIQLHDVVHVLTEYGIDTIGQAEVQAFLLGVKFRLINVILGLGLVRIVYHQICYHKEINLSNQEVWHRLQIAFDRGHYSTLDLDSWIPKDEWNLSLSYVRQHLNILPKL